MEDIHTKKLSRRSISILLILLLLLPIGAYAIDHSESLEWEYIDDTTESSDSLFERRHYEDVFKERGNIMQRKRHKAIAALLALALLTGLAMPAMATHHSFSDVRDSQWYSDAVQFVYENNIMGGVGNNQFNPQGNLTRAQVTALLFRVHNERTANAQDDRNNNFIDVGDTWYAPYVTWAFNNNIVLGTSPTTFNPHGNITRQEFATMVYRYAMSLTVFRDMEVPSAQWSQFTDRGQIAAWAYPALRWMNWQGIVTGTSATTINPTGTATRADAAVMMMRFVEQLAHPLVCPGCGDERSYWLPGANENFEGNSVIIILTRCVSRRDNRDWTLNDFGNIIGALSLQDSIRLSDRQYSYFRRVWDAERNAHTLNTPEAWQAFEIAAREAEEAYPFANWRQFRRFMLIRLDQYCRENVRRVIYQLHQQHEFIYWVGPNHIDTPD